MQETTSHPVADLSSSSSPRSSTRVSGRSGEGIMNTLHTPDVLAADQIQSTGQQWLDHSAQEYHADAYSGTKNC